MSVPYPYRPCHFREGAKYQPNGMPANMDAVLADQCKRKRKGMCCRG